jgi:deoxyribose-phosphate aldolase
MDDREMDLLVESIASRVKARLGLDASADGQAGHACSPDDPCEACGLPPLEYSRETYSPPAHEPKRDEIARYIDHTLLAPEASREDIQELCEEAKKHRFFSVCVNAANVRLARTFLRGSEVATCAVVGFPLGASTAGSKAFEAREAVRCGADEIDMVLNVGALKSREYGVVQDDIRKVVKAVPGKLVKVILETGQLDTHEKVIACALSKVAGADFVKTSTGFGPGGATLDDVRLMREIVGPDMGVKASGGIRDYETAVEMIRAGANRLGCSSSVAIVTGGRGTSRY